ncbi:MAG: LruC domain-containing protein, partial [Dehalococcoidia bacterium]|nr:LruC domain-containing protein [Dehalococcoidia bacterium]
LLASNGARHVIVPGFHLGALIDSEADGQPSADALLDDLTTSDDEDGVTFNTPLAIGRFANITVNASQAGQLNAWFDWNHNGD